MSNEDVVVKIGSTAETEESTETTSNAVEDNGMELVLGGDVEMQEMEQIVGDKVSDEQRANDANKSKRGPKGPRTPRVQGEATTTPEAPKEKEKVDLRNVRILEREIKRGSVISPQGRIEKTAEGDYQMLLAPTLSVRTPDLKFEEVGKVDKLNDGKYVLSCIAGDKFGEKFRVSLDGKSLVEEGQEGVLHDQVRVELHKPGRDKDVVEAYTVSQARKLKGIADEKVNKKVKAEETASEHTA